MGQSLLPKAGLAAKKTFESHHAEEMKRSQVVTGLVTFFKKV
jgi:hypothetical protein